MKTSTRNAAPEGKANGRKALFPGGIFLLATLSPLAVGAPFNISQAPLVAGIRAEANLLYIHDDSGSMYWSYMPDERSGASLNDHTNSAINRLYYTPTVNYVAPPAPPGVVVPGANPPGTLGNASFTEAWFDGYDLAGRGTVGTPITNYCGTGNNAVPRRVNLATNYKPTHSQGCYFGSGYTNEYKTTAVSAAYYRDSAGQHSLNTAEERQNFANWYSYYRTRNYAARAGVGRAFAQLNGSIRVGWGRINKNTGQVVDGKNVTTVLEGVRPFEDARKATFLNWLYGVKVSGGTPLLRALDAAGQYYDRSSGNAGPWADNPATGTGTATAACRKSFTILMTDGYYDTTGAPSPGNADGPTANDATFTTPQKPDTTQEIWTRRPFADDRSNTLADTAWRYWSRDLYGNHSNNKISGTENNPAWWQHMTTFTIGLGVEGTPGLKATAFAASRATPTILPGTAVNWSAPTTNSGKIDDLLHAGVNGHGDFFSAGNPDEFVAGMESMIASIQTETAPTSKLARNESGEKNKDKVTGDTLAYEVQLKEQGGQIFAYGVCSSADVGVVSGCSAKDQIKTTPVWEASTLIPAHGSRNILSTYRDASAAPAPTTTGINFQYASLHSTQQAQLRIAPLPVPAGETKPQLYDAEGILNYVRGDTSKETVAGASPNPPFRNRNNKKLGDIYSDPYYFGPSTTWGYETAGNVSLADQGAYTTWKNSAAYKTMQGMLYVGANDGMLHAFNAKTGIEKAAYVPASVIPKLWKLADPDYVHEYYVDTTPVVGEAQLGSTWSNVLVGTAGAGGRSYFALNVTNPDALTSSKVLWEFTHPELGYNGTGKATVARLKNGEWVAIFGNGYNSQSHKAQLFVVKLSNGSLIKAIEADDSLDPSDENKPNGLSTPKAIDGAPTSTAIGADDQDGAINMVYAGDVRGNLWKFDLSDQDPDTWTAKKLLKAEDASGKAQPITAQPLVVRKRDAVPGWMVYIGTGKFFETTDVTDASVQSFYGVLDTGSGGSAWSRNNKLVKQTTGVEGEDTDPASPTYGKTTATTSSNPVNYAGGDRGFYLDLTAPKERVLTQALYLSRSKTSGTVLVATLIPKNNDADPCSSGTSEGYWIELDALSGSQPAKGMLLGTKNRVKMGTGVTPIHLGGQASTEKFGGAGGAGGDCIGENCTGTEPTLCGGAMIASIGESLKLRKACTPAGRTSWRQLR